MREINLVTSAWTNYKDAILIKREKLKKIKKEKVKGKKAQLGKVRLILRLLIGDHYQISHTDIKQINPFYVIDLFLYPPENIRKPEIF